MNNGNAQTQLGVNQYQLLTLLAGVPLFLFVLQAIQLNSIDALDAIWIAILSPILGLPILATRRNWGGIDPASARYVKTVRLFVFFALAYIIFLRVNVAGNWAGFLQEMTLGRGQRIWQYGAAINIGGFNLLHYSGFLPPVASALYVALYVRGHNFRTVDLTLIAALSAYAFFDFNRLQMVCCAILIVAIPRRKTAALLMAPIMIGAGLFMGVLRSGFDYYQENTSYLSLKNIGDQSYYGQLEYLDVAKIFSPAVESYNIIVGAFSYYVPRSIWPSKPAPSDSDWNGVKEIWVAAGLPVESSLIFGVMPGLLYSFSLYVLLYWVLKRANLRTSFGVELIVGTLIVLLWVPRSFQSFYYMMPIIPAVVMVRQFARLRVR